MIKGVINHIIQSKVHFIILGYLAFGTFVNILLVSDTSVFEIMTTIGLNKNYLCMFLFPSIFAMTLYLHHELSGRNIISIRLLSRKRYIHMTILCFITLTGIFLLEFCLLSIILISILTTPDFSVMKIAIPYQYAAVPGTEWNLLLIIEQLIRLGFVMITFQFITLGGILTFKKTQYVVLLLLLLLLMIYFYIPIDSWWTLGSLIPGVHLFQFVHGVSSMMSTLFAILYFTTLILLCYFYIRKQQNRLELLR